MRLASTYMGVKAQSGDFDFQSGKSAQVLFGGAGTSQLFAAGTTFQGDPIPLITVPGDRVVYRYDFDPPPGVSMGYAYEDGLSAAEFAGGYKSGLGGSGNGVDVVSGYSSYGTPATATLIKLEVADTLDEFDSGGAVAAFSYDDLLFNNQLAAAAGDLAGVPSEYLHVFLNAPAGSGIVGVLDKVVICPTEDALVSIGSGETVSGMTSLQKCNAWFGPTPTPPKCNAYHYTSAAVVGSQHDLYRAKANQNLAIELKWPLVGFIPGASAGVNVVVHTPGAGATVSLHWREMPE